MATRLFFQLFFFILPFLAFGVYRVAIAEAELDGRKPWPIRWLFGIGAGLAVASWLLFIFIDRGGEAYCYTPSRMVDGEIIGGERYPCERDLTGIGSPANRDPGGQPSGYGLDQPPADSEPE
ncbi:MAG: hypothetical protein AAGJ84_08960 [Pseudomonadota bacterium]